MKFKNVKYNEKYVNDAVKMMRKTWSYEKMFKGNVDCDFIYELLFKINIYTCSYYNLVVDENDKLVGFIIASGVKNKWNFKVAKLIVKTLYKLVKGDFGHRLHAIKVSTKMLRQLENTMKYKSNYENEIQLFFIDESTRGNGLGKKLMNRYISFCKKKGIESIILLTDSSCNFSFYDYYGFKRVRETYSEFLPKMDKGYYNSFAYALFVD